MKWNNMKIGYRLAMSFGLILILMAGITAIGVFSSGQAQQSLVDAVQQNNTKSAYVAMMRRNLFRQGLAARNIGATTDLNAMQQEMAKIGVEGKSYQAGEAALVAAGLSPEEQAVIMELQGYDTLSQPFIKQAEESVAGFNAGQALKVLTKDVAPLQTLSLDGIDRLVALQNKQTQHSLTGFIDAGRRGAILMAVICGIALALSALVAWLLSRSIGINGVRLD